MIIHLPEIRSTWAKIILLLAAVTIGAFTCLAVPYMWVRWSRTGFPFTFDGVLQAIATFGGALLGFAIVAWQARVNHNQSLALFNLEYRLKVREHFAPVMRALAEVADRLKIGARELAELRQSGGSADESNFNRNISTVLSKCEPRQTEREACANARDQLFAAIDSQSADEIESILNFSSNQLNNFIGKDEKVRAFEKIKRDNPQPSEFGSIGYDAESVRRRDIFYKALNEQQMAKCDAAIKHINRITTKTERCLSLLNSTFPALGQAPKL